MSVVLRSCPLCGAEQQDTLYLARDRHYGIPGEFPVVRCRACSLVFLNPMYSDEELSRMYPADYYAYQDKFELHSGKELGKRLLGFKRSTKDPHFARPGRMLDLGCGSGWFLRRMKARGWETYGVEVSAAAAELARDSAGLNVLRGTLAQAAFPSQFFDYVRANHSFEHMACPNEVLAEIHRVLKFDGKLMLGLPNIASFTARCFGEHWWYLGAPVHTFNYSEKTVAQLLAKHGFEVERIRHNSDYFGVVGSWQIRANNGNGRKSTEGWRVRSAAMRLAGQWLANLADAAGRGDCMEVTAVKRKGTVA